MVLNKQTHSLLTLTLTKRPHWKPNKWFIDRPSRPISYINILGQQWQQGSFQFHLTLTADWLAVVMWLSQRGEKMKKDGAVSDSRLDWACNVKPPLIKVAQVVNVIPRWYQVTRCLEKGFAGPVSSVAVVLTMQKAICRFSVAIKSARRDYSNIVANYFFFFWNKVKVCVRYSKRRLVFVVV